MVAYERVEHEIPLGRIAGPFSIRPISNMRCSPMGLVPKNTSGWSLITRFSYPPVNSVNDFIDENLTTVQGVRNCKAAEQLFQFHSSKEITVFDCFLSATVKIQRGNFKKLLNSL